LGLRTERCPNVIYHLVSDETETSSAEEQLVKG
jgi:hypothetical protein